MPSGQIKNLIQLLKPLYIKHNKDLPFHGWHHVIFVYKKSLEFAKSIEADELIVGAAALTHDLNYIVKYNSEAHEGKDLRKNYLLKASFTEKEITQIEYVVSEANLSTRDEKMSLEAMALSDADTLFKALPTTLIFFTEKYLKEVKVDIYHLANQIINNQQPLLDKGIYFYTPLAKNKYLKFAEDNLKIWNNMLEILKDEDVLEMLKTTKELGNT